MTRIEERKDVTTEGREVERNKNLRSFRFCSAFGRFGNGEARLSWKREWDAYMVKIKSTRHA